MIRQRMTARDVQQKHGDLFYTATGNESQVITDSWKSRVGRGMVEAVVTLPAVVPADNFWRPRQIRRS
jgi:hypothetical protein